MLFLRRFHERDLSIRSEIPAAFTEYFIRGAQKLYYEDDKRTVFSQYIRLSGFTLWYHVITVHSFVEISPLSIEPGLKLNFMLSEIVAEAALNSVEKVTLVPGHANLFLVGDGLNYAELPAGRHIFFHLDLHHSTVKKLYGNPDAITMLQAIQEADERGGGHINMNKPIETNTFCCSLIADIRQHKYSGEAARVYLQTKARQLLTSFMRDFSGLYPLPETPLTPEDLLRVDAVKAYLKLHLSKPLSVAHVSAILSIKDPESLLQSFLKLHDISVQEFDQHYRMETAFEDVVDTFTPFPTIARSLGYRNRREFRRMFKSYFDRHPEALRRRGKGRQY